MSYTSAQLESQIGAAQQARAQGRINQAQYDSWYSNQQRLISAAKAREAQAQPQQSVWWNRNESRAGVEAQQANPTIKQQLPSGAVITGYNKRTGEVSYRTAQQEQDYQASMNFYVDSGHAEFGGKYAPVQVPSGQKIKDIKETGAGLEFTFESSGQPSALDVAKQQNEMREAYQLRGNVQQGTKAAGSSVGLITQGLSAEDKAAFKVYQDKKVTDSMVRLGTYLGASVAAPLVGPVGAAEAAGLGIGISQGVKTAGVAYEGGDVSKSLLTAEEVFYAGATGIMFSGVSKGGMVGIQKFAPVSVAESVTAKGMKGVLSRASVNAGIGGISSFALSGGNAVEGVKGAAFGAAFSLGGEVVGAGAAKFNAKYDVAPRVFGVKAKELIGVSEVERQVITGKNVSIDRLTTFETRDVTLSYKEAKMYRDLARYSSKPRIMLGGVEKVVRVGGEDFETFMRATEANRSANPILQAVNGKSFRMGEVRLGNVERMVETPSRGVLGVEKTVVSVGAKGKLKVPAIKAKKTITLSEKIIAPKEQLVFREFTGLEIKADVDPQIYAKFGKNLPQENADAIYKALGGNIKPLAEGVYSPKDLAGPMKPMGGSKGSKAQGQTIDEQFKFSQAKIKRSGGRRNSAVADVVAESKENVKAVTLPKNIVKVGQPARANFGSSMIAPNFAQEEDSAVLSYPNKPAFQTDLRIIPEQKNQQQAPNIKPITLPQMNTKNQNITKPNMKPSTSIAQSPVTIPKLSQKTKSELKLGEYPVTVQKTPAQFIASTPQFPKNLKNPLMPSFTLGGGSGGAGGNALLFGKWGKKKHKIKSYQDMLKTFGLGKTAKTFGNMDKSMRNFERQTKRFEKGFKQRKVSKRKVGRRKR